MGKYNDCYNVIDYKSADLEISSGYVIVVPDSDTKTLKSAKKLQKFFVESYEVNLKILSDKSLPLDNEIIVGFANRIEAEKGLNANQIKVSVKNHKLVFGGGHYVTLDSAIEKFIRLSKKEKQFVTFEQETDFLSNVLDGYEYVWGDEFDGEDIDYTKWDFEARMGATEKCEISYDRNVVNVEDGKLKLHGIRVDYPEKPQTKYRVPVSCVTKYKMNFRYGYAEIRCRLPFFSGVWPSFWTQSTDVLSGEISGDFMGEVDMFEVFGKDGEYIVKPGIIKWPHSGGHSFWCSHQETKEWSWSGRENIQEEYHTYGWEWTPDEMSMYVDGQKYMTFDIKKSFDKVGDMKGFHDPMYIIFNNHLMAEDSWQPGSRIEEAEGQLPSRYYIDWIRVYQKPGVGDIWIDENPKEYPDRK
jgi:beta-glucanase (GH16 family)